MKYYTKDGKKPQNTLHIRNNKIEEIYKIKGYYCKKTHKNSDIEIMCNVLGINKAVYCKHIQRKTSRYEQGK